MLIRSCSEKILQALDIKQTNSDREWQNFLNFQWLLEQDKEKLERHVNILKSLHDSQWSKDDKFQRHCKFNDHKQSSYKVIMDNPNEDVSLWILFLRPPSQTKRRDAPTFQAWNTNEDEWFALLLFSVTPNPGRQLKRDTFKSSIQKNTQGIGKTVS